MLQTDDIRINTVRRDKNYEMNPHFHRHNEIYYLDAGKSKMFVDTKLFNLGEGSLVFIRKERIHKTLAGDNFSHVRTVLMFPDFIIDDILLSNDESLSPNDLDSMVIHVPEILRNQVKKQLNNIERETKNPDSFSDIMIKSLIKELIINMTRYYNTQSSRENSNNNILDEVIKIAIDYICANYNNKITLESTAAHINMSPTYFSKKFKRETGFGFKEYLSKYRLREAAKLLKGGKFSFITEVAMQCGFNDSNYFATAFKAEYGISPNKYRHISGA